MSFRRNHASAVSVITAKEQFISQIDGIMSPGRLLNDVAGVLNEINNICNSIRRDNNIWQELKDFVAEEGNFVEKLKEAKNAVDNGYYSVEDTGLSGRSIADYIHGICQDLKFAIQNCNDQLSGPMSRARCSIL